ncbi:MAG: baseplate J/gp47 family protein, partial [Alphaproteobacteria bacterium]|nr:baseplate J/gp47 family protein [Alphaproteobacteria bacterium]
MPLARPELDELRRRVKQDILVRLPGTDPLLRWNNLAIAGEVEAGTAHLLYGVMAWAFRQMFPDTAEGEYLERWANIWGVPRVEATRADGAARWPAEAGRAIATGGIVNRGDGVRYRITAGATTLDGSILCSIEAIDFGARGNAAAGVQLTLQSPPDGVSPLGLVEPPGIGGGADRQSDDLLLQRLLLRIREPPHGGSAADYMRWALEVPGVTRVWPP